MKIEFVIFDWAGTLIDFGCQAPLVAFMEAFAAGGLPISEEVARRPMGTHKRDHAREIVNYPEVAARVRAELRREPDEALVDEFYRSFEARLLDVLPRHVASIPGAVETMQWLRARGVRVGGTTGYTRSMMDVVEPLARAAGVEVEVLVCADEVRAARPAPWACFRIAEAFGIYPMSRGLKVGDTAADVIEGLNANMISVGVAASGNEVGLDAATLAQLPDAEKFRRIEVAATRLRAAGAHHVLQSIADLPAWMEGCQCS